VTHNRKQINIPDENNSETQAEDVDSNGSPQPSEEVGGPKGLEPTRYGDWERKGRCIDF
jgi:hypothetical protein